MSQCCGTSSSSADPAGAPASPVLVVRVAAGICAVYPSLPLTETWPTHPPSQRDKPDRYERHDDPHHATHLVNHDPPAVRAVATARPGSGVRRPSQCWPVHNDFGMSGRRPVRRTTYGDTQPSVIDPWTIRVAEGG